MFKLGVVSESDRVNVGSLFRLGLDVLNGLFGLGVFLALAAVDFFVLLVLAILE